MNLTTHFGLVPRLRMSGSVPLLTLYAIMEWMGQIYLLPFYVIYVCLIL